MAKRFTDNDKWKKPFIRTLETPYKLLWFYILDDCDHAGIWHVDMEVAQLRIGEQININDALRNYGDKVIPFSNNEKWLIIDFIEFQYGQLNSANRVHESVIKLLRKYNLIDAQNKIKPLVSPLHGAKDKDKDMDKLKDKERAAFILKKISEDLNYLDHTCMSFRLPWNKETNHKWLIERTRDFLHGLLGANDLNHRDYDDVVKYSTNSARKFMTNDPEIQMLKNAKLK